MSLRNFRKFLEENDISIRRLAAARSATKSGLQNGIAAGYIGLEMIRDIIIILEDAGFELPDNLWVNSKGIDIQKTPLQTLRRLNTPDQIININAIPKKPKVKRKLKPLTLRARNRYKLNFDPFRNEVKDVNDVFPTPEHEAIISEMRAAADRRDFICITGEVGCGKTTALDSFMSKLPSRIHVIKNHNLDRSKITGGNLLDSIILDLAGEAGESRNTIIPGGREKKNRLVIDLLRALDLQERSAVLVLDEAHGLSRECLRALKRLHEMGDGFTRPLGIILIGQREILPTLDAPNLREVGQRVAIHEFYGLGNLTGKYIEHKIKKAGGNFKTLFDDKAVEEIQKKLTRKVGNYQYGPYALKVNQLVTEALNLADAMGYDKITVDIIDEISTPEM